MQRAELMKPSNWIVGSALALALAGCVSQGKYDQAVAESDALRAGMQKRDAEHRARVAELERAVRVAAVKQGELEDKLALTGDTSRQYRGELDAQTALNASLRAELERLGKNVDSLLAERGALSTGLADAKRRIDEIRRAQAAAEERARLFRSLAVKLQKMIDAGDLRIALRDGRMMLVLPTDVLFDSGKAVVKPNGRRALEEIGSALAGLGGREFQVAGHTDSEPIRFSGYPSNWELSTARALEVVRILMTRGLGADRLSAAGYGEFDPVSDNDRPEGRAKNRRIEITLVPAIDELVAVP